MVNLFAIFGTSFVIALSGAMMPGPLLTVTVSESSRRGFMVGPMLIAGHGILELALVVALMLGLGPFLKQDGVFIVIALAGSAVLLWMAWGMLRALPSLSLSGNRQQDRGVNLLMAGIVMSLANPYWSIWWATIGITYILHSQSFGPAGVAFFFAGHILADLAWYAAVSAAISKGRNLLHDRAYRVLIGACASFLVVFAVLFGWAGIQKLI